MDMKKMKEVYSAKNMVQKKVKDAAKNKIAAKLKAKIGSMKKEAKC
jgi:hypothetical protein